jgi:HD superfamily phosphohydrolase
MNPGEPSSTARGARDEQFSAALATLIETDREMAVWPGHIHRLTRAEALVVSAPPFQRLWRLRQMGQAFHAFPGAENTRASHSLGVAYWSSVYVSALASTEDPATRRRLAAVRNGLGVLSLELVVRLFGLLHDIDLLPLGHTLRYQGAWFQEPPGRPRLRSQVEAIKQSARGHGLLELDPPVRALALNLFERHLDAASGSPFASELANCGLGADLFDFALRDSQAIGQRAPERSDMLDRLRLVGPDGAPRLALALGEGASAEVGVRFAEDLYRARLDVFTASVFHPRKLAADALLDKLLRRIADAGAEPCQADLLALGDDAFLERLGRIEAALPLEHDGRRLSEQLGSGALPCVAYHSADIARFSRRPDAVTALALDPTWRDRIEIELASGLKVDPADVIVAVATTTMQAKSANARLLAADGAVFCLSEASARGFRTEVEDLTAGYVASWGLRVYVAADRIAEVENVARAAEAAFGPGD